MAVRGNIVGIDSPEALERALRTAYYLADEGLATAAYLGLALGKPLLLEGAPGVGKTEAAKAIAAVLGRRLIRLQCYEGIDASAALYEWNYPRQMLAIRQAGEESIDIYGETFLIERPMLASLRAPDSTVLLIDEIDRADQEFEAFLLEFLSDFQISIPERGTVRAAERPVVVLTSNRTRDLHEALRRRCVYHWIDYPTAEREARIVMMRASSVAESTARAVVAAVGRLRREPLSKAPGIAEAVDWAEAATLLHERGARWPDAFKRSIGVALKDEEDLTFISGRLDALHCGGCRVSDELQLPHAARVFVSFVALLRINGFAVAPEQTTAFLAAIELLGPRSMEAIRLAGLATLAPPPERRATYDRLFDIHFLGSEAIDHAGAEDEEVVRLQEEGRGEDETLLADEANESGLVAARAEALVERRFAASATGDALRKLSREAPCPTAAAARPSPHARPPRPVGRSAPHLARERAQRRRGAAARTAQTARPPAQGSVADRRLRLDEGTHRRQHEARACLVACSSQCRGVHLRHKAHPRHPRAASQAPRAGAVRRRPSGQRLGRRHPHRRCAAGVPGGATVRQLCARRRRRHRLRWAGARRSLCPARRGRKLVATRLAPELADAARRRSRLSAADRSADRDPPFRG